MKFKVWEAYAETRICYRQQEIEADSREEALEIARDCDQSPDRRSDEEYGESGFCIRAEGEPEDGDEYWHAYTNIEGGAA